jgi:N-formylglutamate deformylase
MWLESFDAHFERTSVPLLLTVPHAGEWIPKEATWLSHFKNSVLLTDIDRYVDDLYLPSVLEWHLPWVVSRVHRYACDLNRFPEDVDASTVEWAPLPKGKHSTGLHWQHTMHGEVLIPKPISAELHDEIVLKYFHPFHELIEASRLKLRGRFPNRPLYHLDCHSMPSVPTAMHTDEGKGERAEIVLSDRDGKSASPEFRAIVNDAFLAEGFEAVWNEPYKGGRITQRYGKPKEGSEAIQIEIRRNLYMDEVTYERKAGRYEDLQNRLSQVFRRIIPQLAR